MAMTNDQARLVMNIKLQEQAESFRSKGSCCRWYEIFLHFTLRHRIVQTGRDILVAGTQHVHLWPVEYFL